MKVLQGELAHGALCCFEGIAASAWNFGHIDRSGESFHT
jgi:hypothetical protein